MRNSRFISARAAVVAIGLASAAAAPAVGQTWQGGAGGGADTAWATGDNWIGGVAPGTGNDAIFSNSANLSVSGIGFAKSVTIDATASYAISAGITYDAGGAITVPATNGAAHTISAAATWLGSGTITNNSAGLLTLLQNNIPNVAGATLTFDGSGDITINNVAVSSSGVGGVIKNGTGTLNLGNQSNSGLTGGFTLNGGTVITSQQDGVGNRQLNLSNVTLRMDRSNPNSQYTGVDVRNDSTLWFTQTNQWQFGANFPATPSINKLTSSNNNNPKLTVRTQNTSLASTNAQVLMFLNMTEYQGTIDLQDNVQFRLRERGGATSAAAGSAGTAFILGSGSNTPRFVVERPIVDPLTGLAIPTKLGSLTGTSTGARVQGARNPGSGSFGVEFEVGALNTSTSYAGIIEEGAAASSTAPGPNRQGFAALKKVGTGTFVLTGTANNYKGGTVISGGTLAVAGDGSLGAAYDGSLIAFSYNALGSTTTGSPTVTISDPPAGTTAQGNVVVGGTFYFDIPDASAGSGYIANPTVTITGLSDPGLPNGVLATARVKGLVTLDGGTLRTDASFTSNRAVHVTANNGSINTNGFNLTLAGTGGQGNLNGPGTVTKLGAGSLLINTASSLTGDLIVSAGTLGGSGSLNGSDVTVASGATIAPGNSIGSFSVGSAAIGGTFQVEYDGSAVLPALQIDLLNVSGLLDIAAATVDFDALGPVPATPIVFATYGSLATNGITGGFAGVLDLPTGTSIDYNYNGLNQIALVPEPTTLAGLGAVVVLGLRRRRK